ncbi:MAG: ABC transporter substrate-binding protein, partial [Anaerolineales bacterium]
IEAGFSLNADKLWAKDGQPVIATIGGFGATGDIESVLATMLRKAGFDTSVDLSNAASNNILNGGPGLYLWGQGASLTDPYATFELFHSRHSRPPGTPVTDFAFSRYNNPVYDQIIDAMAVLPADDPQFKALAVQAMEIYWRDVIDIPVIQWVHRIPLNQTYWTNWPTQDNLAMGTNPALWHFTAMLVIVNLKPAQ